MKDVRAHGEGVGRYIARKVTFASFLFKITASSLLTKRNDDVVCIYECIVFTYMYLSIYLHPLNKEKKSALSIMSFSIHASSFFLLICLIAYE
jgi:hypothetical protein